MTSNNPILITGLHRSGNTWVNDVLNTAPKTKTIMEVFNPAVDNQVFDGFRFKCWYQFICSENECDFVLPISRRIRHNVCRSEWTAALRSAAARSCLMRRIKLQVKDILSIRLVYKDPISFFSLPWLMSKFGVRPVVLVRHPAAFTASLIRMNWRFPFEDLLCQPLLMDKHLAKYQNEIADAATVQYDLVGQAILLWRIFIDVLFQYGQSNELKICRHEDLSRNPKIEFKKLFDYFGLEFNQKVVDKINETTMASNPDHHSREVHVLKRDSKSNAINWKNRLAYSDVVRIRNATEQVAAPFYGPKDW